MRFKLEFPEAIQRWDEAVPLGNGQTGCLIWGPSQAVRFSLDRTDIWDRSRPKGTDRPEFTYQNLVRLAREKNTEEIRNIFDSPYQYPAPTKLPAGKILLHFQPDLPVEASLDLEGAEVELRAGKGKEQISIQAICHAVNGTGMIRVGALAPAFSFTLENPSFGSTDQEEHWEYDPAHREISQGSLKQLSYPAPRRDSWEEGGIRWERFIQPVAGGNAFGVVLAVREDGEDTLLFYRILSSRDGEDWAADGEKILVGQIARGYEKNREEHRAWWNSYWEKSGIELPEPLAEHQWYLTNYLFASCSRKGGFPMPLQGVWTADDGCLPPWKGDYHNDLNTQLCYSHFYKANHLEEGENFLDFLWNLREQAADFARDFYETEGICLPGVMTIDGQPLGGWPMYSLSPTQQIWLCQSFDLYYRYTGSRKFLEERAWVYFRETALCITDLLEKGEDGKLSLPVSSSPEIHDDEAASWVTPNSNYDLALLRYLYQTLAEYARELNREEEARRWRGILEELPDLAVDERRVLMISPDEVLEESHRHLSNAMAICPLRLIRYEEMGEREIVDATVLDYERLGTGMWVGFSFCWMSHLYGIQGNGEGAWEQLRIFWESFCSVNGFHLNGDYRGRGYSTFHYRPFTLEANMYAADALQEMLLQTEEGKIKLFPAVPEKWKKEELAFERLRAFGGILVSARMQRGKVVSLTLTAEREQEIMIEGALPGGAVRAAFGAGKVWCWKAAEQREENVK